MTQTVSSHVTESEDFDKHFCCLNTSAATQTLETWRCLWVGLNTPTMGSSFWKSTPWWMKIPLDMKWGNVLSTFGASLLPASHLSLRQNDTNVDERVLTIKQWAQKDICRSFIFSDKSVVELMVHCLCYELINQSVGQIYFYPCTSPAHSKSHRTHADIS